MHTHTHTHELPEETATAGQLTDKEYVAQSAAPIPPRLSRYVQPKCQGALFQPAISSED